MMVQPKAFNIYFCLALLIGLGAGCSTTPEKEKEKKEKKMATVLHLHLETRSDGSGHQEKVTVLRDHPVELQIQKSHFLSEVDVEEAKVVDGIGGFSLTLKFDRRGRWLLEQYSTVNVGKRVVIYAQFGEGLAKTRWLGAPVLRRHIGDGVLTFSPDCSREEADDIVRGLNNVSKKSHKSASEW